MNMDIVIVGKMADCVNSGTVSIVDIEIQYSSYSYFVHVVILVTYVLVPHGTPECRESRRPAGKSRQLHQDWRRFDRHRVHRHGAGNWPPGGRQEDGPAETATQRTALQ